MEISNINDFLKYRTLCPLCKFSLTLRCIIENKSTFCLGLAQGIYGDLLSLKICDDYALGANKLIVSYEQKTKKFSLDTSKNKIISNNTNESNLSLSLKYVCLHCFQYFCRTTKIELDFNNEHFNPPMLLSEEITHHFISKNMEIHIYNDYLEKKSTITQHPYRLTSVINNPIIIPLLEINLEEKEKLFNKIKTILILQ